MSVWWEVGDRGTGGGQIDHVGLAGREGGGGGGRSAWSLREN